MKTFKELMGELSERVAVNYAQRRKQAIRMRRMTRSPAFQAKLARKRMRLANNEMIKQRAFKQAKQRIISKFSGLEPSEYKQLNPMQRTMIDNRILAKRGAMLKKVAKRLQRVVKQKEIQRLRALRQRKAEESK